VPAIALRAATELSRAIGIGSVPVLSSRRIDVPTVVGIRSPIVLLPSAALHALPASQARSILAHELGHVARRDCLEAALQLGCETLFWFHPAARRLGNAMIAERELACDDLAVATCGNAREYAGALARLEEMRHALPQGLALAANGGSLLSRIRRLVSPSRETSPVAAVAAISLAMSMLGAAVFATQLAATVHGHGFGRPRAWRFAGPITMNAADPAGHFTVSMQRGRVTGATMAGENVPAHLLLQHGDTLQILDQGGRSMLAVRVKPEGGLSWAPRPVRPSS
jgi:hypothetical protein